MRGGSLFEGGQINLNDGDVTTEKLIAELGLSNAKQVLDYTHAKQNISIVKKIISDALKLSKKESGKLLKKIRELLWDGNITGISDLVRVKLVRKKKAAKGALKKLNEYFGAHYRFQYKTFCDNGLPTYEILSGL